jgi:hypothetical protein
MAGARRTRTTRYAKLLHPSERGVETPMSAEKSSEETNPRDAVRPVPVPEGGQQEPESPFAGASQVPPWEL